MGNSYFLKIIKEDESGWIYLFGDKMGEPTHLVGWLPLAGDSSHEAYIEVGAEYDIISATLLNGTSENEIKTVLPQKKKNGQLLKLLAQPTVFQLNN